MSHRQDVRERSTEEATGLPAISTTRSACLSSSPRKLAVPPADFRLHCGSKGLPSCFPAGPVLTGCTASCCPVVQLFIASPDSGALGPRTEPPASSPPGGLLHPWVLILLGAAFPWERAKHKGPAAAASRSTSKKESGCRRSHGIARGCSRTFIPGRIQLGLHIPGACVPGCLVGRVHSSRVFITPSEPDSAALSFLRGTDIVSRQRVLYLLHQDSTCHIGSTQGAFAKSWKNA